jgi:hypothetical protein
MNQREISAIMAPLYYIQRFFSSIIADLRSTLFLPPPTSTLSLWSSYDDQLNLLQLSDGDNDGSNELFLA